MAHPPHRGFTMTLKGAWGKKLARLQGLCSWVHLKSQKGCYNELHHCCFPGFNGARRSERGCRMLSGLPDNIALQGASHDREEQSMDQYRSRQKLSENFEGHWSIPFPGEIHMDQSLVHTFSWGNLYGPMVLKVFQKFPLHWHWSMDGRDIWQY